LRRQAVHDALTDLPNRVLLFDRLEQAILKTGRPGKLLALLFPRPRRLLEINDTFGHLCGDGLLRQVAGRLRLSCARPIPWRVWAATSSRSCCLTSRGGDRDPGRAGASTHSCRRSRSTATGL
jgi:hypothetical protein